MTDPVVADRNLTKIFRSFRREKGPGAALDRASFYPTARFLYRTEFLSELWAVPLVAAVSLALALSIWKAGVGRYHSTGS
jgi:ABC-2 family transporter protein